ncbi:MAG: class I SAM-dependent methyltransferase [Chloroflexota bacterium]
MTSAGSCRSCGHDGLEPILSLGQMPLANRLLLPAQLAEPEPRYPLDLAFCPSCALVQITETVPPEILFHEYAYFSSFSDTMLQSVETLVGRLIRERALGPDSLAVEIGSNDGYLLQYYQRAGVPVLGIDPAVNVARVAREQRSIPTVAELFDDTLAASLVAEGRQADVIHANNVLAHVANLNGVVRGISLLLKPSGVAVIETPYVRDLVERGEFDTIYHEHLCYYSLTALTALFGRHGMVVRDVEQIPVHGGSLRLFVGKAAEATAGTSAERGHQEVSARVTELLRAERAAGLDRRAYYDGLAQKAVAIRRALQELLADLRARGKTVAAYGAAAKGAILLNYCGLGAESLAYVVDRNQYKQGRYLPGVRLPISGPERLLEQRPDYLLILVWNLTDEIVAQQAAYRESGGRFIVPVPAPRILDGPGGSVHADQPDGSP